MIKLLSLCLELVCVLYWVAMNACLCKQADVMIECRMILKVLNQVLKPNQKVYFLTNLLNDSICKFSIPRRVSKAVVKKFHHIFTSNSNFEQKMPNKVYHIFVWDFHEISPHCAYVTLNVICSIALISVNNSITICPKTHSFQCAQKSSNFILYRKHTHREREIAKEGKAN